MKFDSSAMSHKAMQHLPESMSDAINTSELGALIAEHRNTLLCELLRPMLDTLDREGIQLSAVLRALATIASERSPQVEPLNGSNPWERCNKLLHQARASAEEAERSARPRRSSNRPAAATNAATNTNNHAPLELHDVRPALEDISEEDAWARELIGEA
ncbi:MAG TPA: hypothetical protein V6D46_05370 [Coleofasciculaceae cyanobacterium]